LDALHGICDAVDEWSQSADCLSDHVPDSFETLPYLFHALPYLACDAELLFKAWLPYDHIGAHCNSFGIGMRVNWVQGLSRRRLSASFPSDPYWMICP
jgi:hypothetical protein